MSRVPNGLEVREHARWTSERTAVARFIHKRLGLMKDCNITAPRNALLDRAALSCQRRGGMSKALRRWALELAKPIHVRLRSQKVELFRQHLSGEGLTLLDVGGSAGIDGEFLQLYSQFSKVVIANIESSFDGLDGHRVSKILADGRQLPFADKSFDWVFSNAVIEHVGDWADQEHFAQEIRRVASCGYFVTTPNRYFPLEPHTLLPCYQFLPVSVQRRVARYSPGYVREYEQINLLSAAQMRLLFPEAEVFATGFPIIGNSLVACGVRGRLHAHNA